MRAVVVESPGVVAVRDIPEPRPADHEALVRIEACGLCGTTDRHIVEGRQAHHPADRYPAVLGHEAVGTVVETGKNVRRLKKGDRVTRPAAVWPGTEQDGLHSAWGGFAEYGIVRDSTAAGAPEADYTEQRQHVVPPELSLEDAVAAVSISEVYSWMRKLGPLDGQSVVIGGTGFAANVMGQCARAAGAERILFLGRNTGKFPWCLRNGATDTLVMDEQTDARVKELTGGGGDWFLDAAGHQEVFATGLSCLRPGGRAAIYGAPEGFAYTLPLGAVGGDFSVHYLAPEDDLYYQETCARMIAGDLDAAALCSHRWDGLDAIHQALSEQAAGKVLKGIIGSVF